MGLKLGVSTYAYGYITLTSGWSSYASLPAAVGVLSGSFVVDVKFRATSFAHQGLMSKLNPSSGGGGSARGWLLGFSPAAKLKFYYCTADGTIVEFAGTTTLSTGTDYVVRLQSDGTTVLVRLSSNDGGTWNTECTVTNTDCISMFADNNSYPVNLGRGRWAGSWGDYFNGRMGIIRIIKGSNDPNYSLTNEYRMATTGSNPAIIDRVDGLSGTSYNSTSGTTIANDVYKLSGSAVYGPFSLSAAGTYHGSSLVWTVSMPANTTLIIKTAITQNTTPPGSYQTAATIPSDTSPKPIPGFTDDEDLSTTYLWIRVEATSTAGAGTPDLTALSAWVIGPDYTDQIKVTLPNSGRLKFPQGDVTVYYNKTVGGMAGTQNVQVESFDIDFTPTGIVPVFNPMVTESLTAQVQQSVVVSEVTYSDRRSPFEYLTALIDQVISVTKVGDLPL